MRSSRLRLVPLAVVLSASLAHASAARGDAGDNAARVLEDPTYQKELPRPEWSGGGESFGGGSLPSLSLGGGGLRSGPGPGDDSRRQPNVDDSWGDGSPRRGDGSGQRGDGSGSLDLGGGTGSGQPGDGSGQPGDGSGQPGDGSGQPGDGSGRPGDDSGQPGDGSAPPPGSDRGSGDAPRAGSGNGPSAANQPPARSARDTVVRRKVVTPPSAPSPGQQVASTFAMILLGVLVAGVLIYVLSKLVRAKTKLDEETAEIQSDAPAANVEMPRDPNVADQLAAEGRFDEAVHVLLVCALERLSKTSEQPLSDHLTSREILRRVSGGPNIHGALTELVRAVEASLFGGASLNRADYDRCLTSFRVVSGAS